ncbi:hypothetical protein [Chitinophaga nivalis]|uniref:Uncharacterized protein n=1 Tax=Chitinophaga nivalis TaxID=2991709 RepID=A0ABT3IM75_9BACT|nr:hypothetical protein [Chitinophaga nivalis]MCW3465242.1 hypothetical protein [Chitinophaga nivalis]MCW3485066.1 hypothetical protein [Chitinophaga nivalis]
MLSTAPITVYLQATGGKFLGPHAFQPENITVIFTYDDNSTTPLSYGPPLAIANDGFISDNFVPGCSSSWPIITPAVNGQPTNVNYLQPTTYTIAATGDLVLPEVAQSGTLSASIPLPFGAPLLLTQSLLLLPQQSAFRLIIPVPGLLVTNGSIQSDGSICVYVTMMCGCKITQGLPTSYWLPEDFTVNANILYEDGTTTTYAMSLDTTTNDSLFSVVPATDPGVNISNIFFTALQNSTGNYGYLPLYND